MVFLLVLPYFSRMCQTSTWQGRQLGKVLEFLSCEKAKCRKELEREKFIDGIPANTEHLQPAQLSVQVVTGTLFVPFFSDLKSNIVTHFCVSKISRQITYFSININKNKLQNSFFNFQFSQNCCWAKLCLTNSLLYKSSNFSPKDANQS